MNTSTQELLATIRKHNNDWLWKGSCEALGHDFIHDHIPILLELIDTQSSQLQKAKSALIKAKDVMETLDNKKGGYDLPHTEYCMSQRTEVREDMEFYRHDEMEVCDCYLNDALEAIEECDEAIKSLTPPL